MLAKCASSGQSIDGHGACLELRHNVCGKKRRKKASQLAKELKAWRKNTPRRTQELAQQENGHTPQHKENGSVNQQAPARTQARFIEEQIVGQSARGRIVSPLHPGRGAKGLVVHSPLR